MNEELIWAASEIDTGYFCIKMSDSCYYANIRIRRNDEKTILNIQRVLGGGFGRGKEYYWLNFNGQHCTTMLKLVLPYLRKKVAHARIIMEFNYEVANRQTKGRLTEEEREKRHMVMLRLKLMN